MKKKKSRKKLVIGVGILVVAVVAGVNIYGSMNAADSAIPQVKTVSAVRDNVQQTVEISGTVVSEEQKTYFSPVNAKVDTAALKEGETVKAGTSLIEFDQKDLEREAKKADLNVESGKLDMKNTLNKSDEAVRKQQNAAGDAASLKQQVAAQENYVASLKARISQANANAQAASSKAAAKKQADAAAAQEAQQQEIQREYAQAQTTYQNETLPAYQNQLNTLNNEMNQAQSDYNQAENSYQMAFQAWSADQSDDNENALEIAEQMRSEAQITYQNAKTAYEDYKAQKPAAPVMSDFTGDTAVTADTTALENELEKASNNLAELQSELSSKEAAAEADTGAVTEEEKEKMEITNNLSELDQMSAQELVEAAKKGIKADFNGVVTKVSVVEGATATQGMELFTLQNTDKVDVNVNVSKYDYDKVKEGQSADITIAGKTYEGEVTSISHVATQNEKGASLISADIRIKNPDEDIFLGVDAKVTIHAEEADNVVVLPSEVVNIGKEGSFCYVLENGVITKKDITTGISSDEYVEVLDGIKEGDEVIRDLGSLEEGMQAEAADRSGDVNGENTETDNAEEGI